jgi:septal ring factor EnvC (AmiA/AmiB activator)
MSEATLKQPATLDDVVRLLKQQNTILTRLEEEQALQGQRLDGVFLRLTQDRRRDIVATQKFDEAMTVVMQELDETQAKVTAIGNVVDGGVATIQQLAASQAATQAMLDDALKGLGPLTDAQQAKFDAVKARNDAFQQALLAKATDLAKAIEAGTKTTTA